MSRTVVSVAEMSRMVGLSVIIDQKESTKKEVAKLKVQQQKNEDRKGELEKRKTDLMRAISEAENQIIADILSEVEVSEAIFESVRSGRWGSFFEPGKTAMENYRTSMTVRAAINNEVKSRYAKRFQKMKEHEELERVTRVLASM